MVPLTDRRREHVAAHRRHEVLDGVMPAHRAGHKLDRTGGAEEDTATIRCILIGPN
jgi:hypothetical protein